MGERLAGQSYLTFWRSVQYMVKMSISILLIPVSYTHLDVYTRQTVSVDTPKDLPLVNEILKEKQHG